MGEMVVVSTYREQRRRVLGEMLTFERRHLAFTSFDVQVIGTSTGSDVFN